MSFETKEIIYLCTILFEAFIIIFSMVLLANETSQCSKCNDCVHYCKRKHTVVSKSDICRKVPERRR